MRNILVIGSGQSSSSLITYLLNKSISENLHITVADVSLELAKSKVKNHKNGTARALDILNDAE
ncbi:MAG: saccharopine dehydrogenase, partial [Lutibacter sp.]|nr:saccharopine dehydrogenase [Lutibacter sp.]